MGASLLAEDVAITSGITTITSVVSQVWTTMTEHLLRPLFFRKEKTTYEN